jgi:putative transposase
MRRLLTGHAATYNRRHRRSGHLFQNRYKSILCQEENYLLELVRYIHLNPLRAKLVNDLRGLASYPYSGHRALIGKGDCPWQDAAHVLKQFGRTVKAARQKYREFVASGISEGQRPDLIGGGLIRSMGGWEAVKASRLANVFMKGDERILGDGDFVAQVLDTAQEAYQHKQVLQSRGIDTDAVARHVADLFNIEEKRVRAPGKNRLTVKARSLFCFWSVDLSGVSMSSLARKLELSVTSISQSVKRGRCIAAEENLSFDSTKL